MLRVADAVAIEEGINGLNFSLLGVLHGLATLSNLNFECQQSFAQVSDVTMFRKDFVVFGLGQGIFASNLFHLVLRFSGIPL